MLYQNSCKGNEESALLKQACHVQLDLENGHLKTILWKNNYPPNFIDYYVNSLLYKLYTPKFIVQNVPKRNVFVKLPFW